MIVPLKRRGFWSGLVVMRKLTRDMPWDLRLLHFKLFLRVHVRRMKERLSH